MRCDASGDEFLVIIVVLCEAILAAATVAAAATFLALLYQGTDTQHNDDGEKSQNKDIAHSMHLTHDLQRGHSVLYRAF